LPNGIGETEWRKFRGRDWDLKGRERGGVRPFVASKVSFETFGESIKGKRAGDEARLGRRRKVRWDNES